MLLQDVHGKKQMLQDVQHIQQPTATFAFRFEALLVCPRSVEQKCTTNKQTYLTFVTSVLQI